MKGDLKMNGKIICFLLLISIVLSGCQHQKTDETSLEEIYLTTSEKALISNSTSIYEGYDEEIPYSDSIYEETYDNMSDLDEYTIETQPIETAISFESYEIKVRRNSLSVYALPGYKTDNWLYDITDRRTIKIVEERVVIGENSVGKKWGKLETGGWVNLSDAYVEEDLTDNESARYDDKSNSDSIETTKSTLGGTLVWNGVLGSQYIYGCGNRHSITENGIVFYWYDRYERRDANNTRVYSYLDIKSFGIDYEYSNSDTQSWGSNAWVISYEVDISSGVNATLLWTIYDKDQYYLSEIPMSLGGSSTTTLKGKCKGELRLSAMRVDSTAKYAELCPSI